jgi:carboxypeptidase Q
VQRYQRLAVVFFAFSKILGTLSMKQLLLIALVATSTFNLIAGDELSKRFKADANRMLAWTREDRGCYDLIADFTDHYPRRISGSENLEKGLDWLIEKMTSEGWNVKTQPVMVPNWKRGKEALSMTQPMARTMQFCGLGGSVGTDGKPLTAGVLVVKSYDELKQRKAEVPGKIVVYNVPFTTYGETVNYRYNGPSAAAELGAVATLMRSVGPDGIQTVHTGGMGYKDGVPKIPCGAITIEDALLMQRMQDRGENMQLTVSMEAKWMPDAPSRNVIIEIPGSELPNEVVVMGGHIDSWDIGTGAMDDAGGCIAAWRALYMMQQLGMRPKRTIRVCFWTNEENGLRGGEGYAKQTPNEKHLLAIESDAGVFAPTGFNTDAKGAEKAAMEDIAKLLSPVHANNITEGGGGADIGPLKAYRAVMAGLEVQGDRYFWYHHTEGDTVDKLKQHEVNDCVYAMAVLSWCWANR